MPGFTPSGEISSTSATTTHNVVFALKSSAGKELKTYTVSASEADKFEAGVRAEEPKLREEAGETDPLMLIKIQRAF